MESGQDLATAALVALARKMPNDEWAQHQLNQIGLRPSKSPKERTFEVHASVGIGSKASEKNLPAGKPQYPVQSFLDLLEHALRIDRYERVLIAIDDLDKRNPTEAWQLLKDVRAMLKGSAYFLVTGDSIEKFDALESDEPRLFDNVINLKKLQQNKAYQLLINHLNRARLEIDCTDPLDSCSIMPFNQDAAQLLCKLSDGDPRLLNRLGMVVINEALDVQASTITPEIVREALRYFFKHTPWGIPKESLQNIVVVLLDLLTASGQ